MLKKKLEESREQVRVQAREIKSGQQMLAEERVRSSRAGEKIKELSSDIEIKREYMRELEEKYR